MRKINWKIMLFIWLPLYLLIMFLFGLGGVIGAAITATLAYVPLILIMKFFNIDINLYYNHDGRQITKEEYEKIDNKVDYGFRLFQKKKK